MSRRDTIIIAVLINAGLLAVLFIMAINTDDEKIVEQRVIEQSLVYEQPPQSSDKILSTPNSIETNLTDEFDHVLSEMAISEMPQPILMEEITTAQQPISLDRPAVGAVEPSPQKADETSQSQVAVTVKRGDSLEKIAKANGTTISAITKANNLKTEKLKIGQVLQIPIAQNKEADKPTASVIGSSKAVEAKDTEYYTIKSGDNPWKIAKQFHVKFDDLLKLNNLDEEKARNLKIGDKIRIH